MRSLAPVLVLGLCFIALESEAKGREYPPDMRGASVETYKKVGDVQLKMWIFMPEGHQPTNRSAAIVFFFGGGWESGSPQQFEPHCRHLASLGMVAVAADYRVKSRQGALPVQCVADAKSAIRYVRANAARLGIDPNRIAVGGGSAGGHIAACTGTAPDLDEPGEDKAVSSVPNAMVLFNPALLLAPLAGKDFGGFGARVPASRLGVEPVRISPAHQVKAGAPPTIIFHGRADSTVPYATAEAFAEVMKAAGNRCELYGYDGQAHGFFNDRPGNRYYAETVQKMDDFLTSLGYLRKR